MSIPFLPLIVFRKQTRNKDVSDTGNIVDDTSGGCGGEDSFQRQYSKELDLDEGRNSYAINIL